MSLLGRCEVRVLRRGPELVAAVWFQPLSPLVADLHVHSAPEARGRWVSGAALRYLARAARGLGVRYLSAYPLPQHADLIRRLGFTTQHGGVPLLKLYEPPCPPTNSCTASAAP